jgi:hypothetical protein
MLRTVMPAFVSSVFVLLFALLAGSSAAATATR